MKVSRPEKLAPELAATIQNDGEYAVVIQTRPGYAHQQLSARYLSQLRDSSDQPCLGPEGPDLWSGFLSGQQIAALLFEVWLVAIDSA